MRLGMSYLLGDGDMIISLICTMSTIGLGKNKLMKGVIMKGALTTDSIQNTTISGSSFSPNQILHITQTRAG